VLISSHRKLLWSKAMVVSVAEKSGRDPGSKAPGFGEKYRSLSGFPSHSLQSGGGASLTVIFGQALAYSGDSHFSTPGVSGLILSTGHSGSQPAVDALVRMGNEHVLALIEAVNRAYLDTVHKLTANTAIVNDIGQLGSPLADCRG
jgi:hypothetical protein